MVKDLAYAKVNSWRPLYLIIGKIRGYIEKSNGNKFLALVFTDKSKETRKKYEKLWNKIWDFINRRVPKSIINNWDNYDDKYMKTKFNLGNDYPLKTLKLYDMVTVIRFVVHESHKYYHQVFLRECLYKWNYKC